MPSNEQRSNREQKLRIELVPSMKDIDAKDWDRLNITKQPFISHAFLNALEVSGSVRQSTGITPLHLCVFDADTLIAAMPMYIKEHSYGEYIFDWQVAEAAFRNGIEYYPKLLIGVPYTPVTGQRFLIANGIDRKEMTTLILNAISSVVEEHKLSSAHILFCTRDEFDLATWHAPFIAGRFTSQYHYLKKDEDCYDGFLERCRSRHRKQIRKERRLPDSLKLDIPEPEALTAEDFSYFYKCYQATHEMYGNPQYLTEDFFTASLPNLRHLLSPTMAYVDGRRVASTVNFHDQNAIYGRYWGTTTNIKNLHFELCYHQLIEHAIETGRTRVEAGAGGGHKIKRGFEPVYTYSLHHYRHPGFHQAVAEFYDREKQYIDAHIEQTKAETPFKENANT